LQSGLEQICRDTANSDLDEIINYITEEKNVQTALKIMQGLEKRSERLVSIPERGVVVPELHDIGILQYRQLSEKPWRIIYRISGDIVYVIAVIDSRRNMLSCLMDRLLRL